MLQNYFKIAWRNLVKNKTFSVINITGLAIGLAGFLLIMLYVLNELSYDRFNEKANRIYRISADIKFGGSEMHIAETSDMMGQVLKKDYPEVEGYTRIYNNNGAKLVKKGDGYLKENNVANADSTFFNVFTLPAVAGDTRTALNEPNTVVISESTARKYFGQANAVGKTLQVNEDNKELLYKVTAVIKDIPANAHFHFDFLFSMKNTDYEWGQYTSHNFHTYLVLKEGTDYHKFEKHFDEYKDKYVLPAVKQIVQINSMDEFKKSGNMLEYKLTPLLKLHLYSTQVYELSPNGNIQYVYIFSIIAVFILVIACINFMNLTTARSASRSKEVGIRKVLGTERKELMIQFLFESILMVFISLVIALGIAWLVLPLFNNVADKDMHFGSLLSPVLLPLIIALPFVVGLLAGSYPAFFLSAFKPIEVLKGKLKLGAKSGGLRSTLVVVQFCTSIILIIGTIVIYKQLHYIQNKNIGYNKDQVLVINDAYALKDNIESFRNEVLQLNGVSNGTLSSFLPVSNSSRSDQSYFKSSAADIKSGLDMQSWTVDYDYQKTMGINMAKGRFFSKEFGSDSTAVVINESTASLLGYADPVGQKIYRITDAKGTIAPLNIIGVVKNFNFESLHTGIAPMCLMLGKSYGLASFKFNSANTTALLQQVENKWKALAPGMPFSYRFMDNSFDEMYRTEQRIGKIVLTFSILAILIACLGLFGLATFIAEQRTKEIGIRKVLGASVQGIIGLLSKDFVRLVIISFIIAAPLAWWFMHQWLSDFAYRINIEWWMFAMAGFGAMFIALATVSFQAIRTALMNPVKSLRTE